MQSQATDFILPNLNFLSVNDIMRYFSMSDFTQYDNL